MTQINVSEKKFTWFSSVRYEHLVAGLGGGVMSTLVLHPLDVLKIRFAVSDGKTGIRPSYGGIKHAVSSIVKSEGVRGMYAGMSPNLVGAGAAWGFYFFFYNWGKSVMQAGDLNKQLSAATHLATASMSGILTLTMTNPIWVVKTRLILQSSTDASLNTQYSDIFRFVPGLFGVSHGAIQFMSYEQLKNSYLNYHQMPISSKLGNTEYLFFAAISKLIAAFTTYPYQVVRARLQDRQLKYSGSIDCIRRTYSGEGLTGFYKGLIPNLLRVVPATMITFVVYENVSHHLLNRSNPPQVSGVLDMKKES
ncbi:mitochondrial folate transporter/carrier [Eurytemora carolleeae]|uniref:mitochondrial folate transporter/carrier n=1 Tax=Eurytemora carolleeae TaxID=1294199 RepID=UPI000C79166F|nr:mitochondrial folate transporter/carrier [Eurytemora carolleeae]|eukprot:XP_023343345.1 mitochondrial folate transporter/carrier-like [Eurytemora affinis]